MSSCFSTALRPYRLLISRIRSIAAASVWLIIHSHLGAATQNPFTEGGQSLNVEFPNGYQSRYGFHPVKLTAVNTGAQPAVWEIRVNEQGMRDRTLNDLGHRERIVVPPKRTIERELLVAIGKNEERASWSYLQVQVITPSGETRSWHPDSNPGNSSYNRGTAPALLTPQAAAMLMQAPGPDDDYHGRLNPASASGDWRAYAAFSVVALTADDWQAMTAAARGALGDWTRMGGHLQFLGGMPEDAPAPDVSGQPARGLGGVHPPPESRSGNRASFSDLPAAVPVVKSLSPPHESMRSGESLLIPWLQGKDADLLRDRFTVWPMVLVLIAFFVMITPINLFVLAPTRRRHRLFRTIPVISLSACALLALAVGLGDGLGGRGQRLVWIESRPGTENRQYITQWQASRCGALIGAGFTVPDAAFLAPLRAPASRVTLSVAGDRLDAGGGWFTSRATQSHLLQAARPGRGRIEWVTRDQAAPTAVSTFDFPLRDVYLRSADGSWWMAAAMRQGETTTLQRVELKQVNDVINASIHDFPQESDIRSMAHRPGHFIAFTDQPPAIATLSSVRWRDTGIVTGALANP